MDERRRLQARCKELKAEGRLSGIKCSDTTAKLKKHITIAESTSDLVEKPKVSPLVNDLIQLISIYAVPLTTVYMNALDTSTLGALYNGKSLMWKQKVVWHTRNVKLDDARVESIPNYSWRTYYYIINTENYGDLYFLTKLANPRLVTRGVTAVTNKIIIKGDTSYIYYDPASIYSRGQSHKPDLTKKYKRAIRYRSYKGRWENYVITLLEDGTVYSPEQSGGDPIMSNAVRIRDRYILSRDGTLYEYDRYARMGVEPRPPKMVSTDIIDFSEDGHLWSINTMGVLTNGNDISLDDWPIVSLYNSGTVKFLTVDGRRGIIDANNSVTIDDGTYTQLTRKLSVTADGVITDERDREYALAGQRVWRINTIDDDHIFALTEPN